MFIISAFYLLTVPYKTSLPLLSHRCQSKNLKHGEFWSHHPYLKSIKDTTHVITCLKFQERLLICICSNPEYKSHHGFERECAVTSPGVLYDYTWGKLFLLEVSDMYDIARVLHVRMVKCITTSARDKYTYTTVCTQCYACSVHGHLSRCDKERKTTSTLFTSHSYGIE